MELVNKYSLDSLIKNILQVGNPFMAEVSLMKILFISTMSQV